MAPRHALQLAGKQVKAYARPFRSEEHEFIQFIEGPLGSLPAFLN